MPFGRVVIWSRSVGSAGEGGVRDAVAYFCSREEALRDDAVFAILDACRGSDSDLLMMFVYRWTLEVILLQEVQKLKMLARSTCHIG